MYIYKSHSRKINLSDHLIPAKAKLFIHMNLEHHHPHPYPFNKRYIHIEFSLRNLNPFRFHSTSKIKGCQSKPTKEEQT